MEERLKILHILTKEPEGFVRELIDEQKQVADVIEIKLFKEPVDYEGLIKCIEETNKLFTW